jgi:hypothetical protein
MILLSHTRSPKPCRAVFHGVDVASEFTDLYLPSLLKFDRLSAPIAEQQDKSMIPLRIKNCFDISNHLHLQLIHQPIPFALKDSGAPAV